MGLFDFSEEKKRAKEIRKEGKVLRKELLSAGLEKKMLDVFLEEFLVCLEAACIERDKYKNARGHMKSCMDIIDEILSQMREMSVDTCKAKLSELLSDLPLVFHPCLIRTDDIDFATTLSFMKNKIPVYCAEDRLMMQSELENLKAVFSDAVEWNAPEFLSLAYFLRHGKSELLSDMENSQRNNYMENYYKEQFWDQNVEWIEKAGMLEKVLQFEKQTLVK